MQINKKYCYCVFKKDGLNNILIEHNFILFTNDFIFIPLGFSFIFILSCFINSVQYALFKFDYNPTFIYCKAYCINFSSLHEVDNNIYYFLISIHSKIILYVNI